MRRVHQLEDVRLQVGLDVDAHHRGDLRRPRPRAKVVSVVIAVVEGLLVARAGHAGQGRRRLVDSHVLTVEPGAKLVGLRRGLRIF